MRSRHLYALSAALLFVPLANALDRTTGWAAAPIGAGSPVVSTPIVGELNSGIVGDFDGNGVTDVADFRGPTLLVSLGTAAGTFTASSIALPASTTFPVGRAVTADFDRDGRLDLIGTMQSCSEPPPFGCRFTGGPTNGVGWMRGLTGGSFAAPAFLLTSSAPNVLVGDFAGDALPDLALWPMFLGTDAAGARYGISILPNLGGAFGPRIDVVAGIGAGPQSVKVARADGDARDDLFVFWNEYDVSNSLRRFVGTVRGGATPTLVGAQEVVASPYGWDDSWVTAGDVNGDQRDDLLAMDYVADLSLRYYLRVSGPDGALGSPTEFVPEARINERAVPSIGDVTGDGKADLVYLVQVPDLWFFDASIAPGNGDGTFGPAFGLTRRLYAGGLRVRDFDGDGDRDIHIVHSDPTLGTWYRTIIRNPVGVGDGTDRNAPIASILSPGQGRTYEAGEAVVADYACADEVNGSGLASCLGSVANGTAVDTGTPGSFSFIVVARDAAGNESTTSVSYSVNAPTTTTTVPDTTTTVPDTTTTTAPPGVSVSVADLSLPEGAALSSAVFTVTLSRPSADNVRVSYTTGDGTATAADDYRSRTGSVLIPAGSTSATIAVTVVGDAVVEPDEAFTMTLTAVTEGTAVLGDAAGVALILNDDANVEVSVADATIAEGNTGLVSAAVVLTLSGPAPAPVRLSYATADGSAVAPGDYRSRTGTLLIPSGATSATIAVTVVGDTAQEPDEAFAVTLTAVTSGPAVISDASATVTITNDDANVGVSVADVAIIEGDRGAADVVIAVTLTAAAPSIVRVAYATADGTARAGADYRALNGTLAIAAGATTGTIKVKVIGDIVAEPQESFLLTLTGVTSGPADLVDATAVATITDND
jgi:hypothetical protein